MPEDRRPLLDPAGRALQGLSFFYSYGIHRDLHSFPTRRSSDLPRRDLIHRNASLNIGSFRFLGVRSEEHTSELQSHSDLVCRLLLEKKKRFVRGVVQPSLPVNCTYHAAKLMATRGGTFAVVGQI